MATITATTIIIMTDKNLIQLMTLLSPVFPVGGFAYSSGLESAAVTSKSELKSWIETSLSVGWMRNDAILLANAHRGETPLSEINDLALALAGSSERFEESINLGGAFVEAAGPWLEDRAHQLPDPCAYAVAIGGVTAQLDLDINLVLLAYFQAAVSNQLQAGLRLISLGQQAAVSLQHELEPAIQSAALDAARSQLDDLGSCAIAMDMAAMNHETMTSRIFRS